MKLYGIFLFFAVFILVTSIHVNGVTADCDSQPPVNGSWVINKTDLVNCNDVEIILNGNLTINGILNMNNVTLIMNSTNNTNVTIYHIENNGTLEIMSSAIKSNGMVNYLFWSVSSTPLILTDTNISDCGMDSTESKYQGFYVEGEDTEIQGNIFRNSYAGIIVNGDNNRVVDNNFFINIVSSVIGGDGNNFSSNILTGDYNEIDFTGNDFYISSNSFSNYTVNIEGSDTKFINNAVDLGNGLLLNGNNCIIKNNVISHSEYGINTGAQSDSDNNTVQNNTLNGNRYGLYIDSKTSNSMFTENFINGDTTNDFSVAGIYLKGIENVLDKNTIECNVYGVRVLSASYNNVSENTMKDNKYGLYSTQTSSLLVKDSVIKNNTIIDINLLSTSLILNNTNYTTFYTNWTVSMEAFDINGTRVNFTAQIYSNTTDMDFSDDSVNGEKITFNVPEFFEDKDLNSSITNYNPYIITVSNTLIGGFNLTPVNITSDFDFIARFNGTYNDSDGNAINFVLSVYSPRNQTYLKADLINNTIIAEVQSIENLTSCVYILNGDLEQSMLKEASKDFKASITASDLQDGLNRIYFRCTGPGGIQNTTDTVYFTAYSGRECLGHDDCLGNEFCDSNYKCAALDCGCGVATDHECTSYECCDDDVCELTEHCSNHKCTPVSCDCPERISNHRCQLPAGYCCKSTMCTGANEICDMNLNKCIERTLKISLSSNDITVGEEIIITVKDMQGVAVEGVDITANFESGNKLTAKTDKSGKAAIKTPEPGEVNIIARKSGYAAASSKITVREGFNLIIVIVIIVAGLAAAGAFLFFRSRSSSKTPVTMKKVVQGNNVTLTVKNDTKETLQEIVVNDQVPAGAFISSSIQPEITSFDANTNNLAWKFLSLEPGQEITITYEAYKTMQGFSVKVGVQEFISPE